MKLILSARCDLFVSCLYKAIVLEPYISRLPYSDQYVSKK